MKPKSEDLMFLKDYEWINIEKKTVEIDIILLKINYSH